MKKALLGISLTLVVMLPVNTSAQTTPSTDRTALLQQQIVILQQLIALLTAQLETKTGSEPLDDETHHHGQSTDESGTKRAGLALLPEQRTFSNTQEWDRSLVLYLDNRNDVRDEYVDRVNVPPPPTASDDIEEEIAELKSRMAERTDEKEAEIIQELEVEFAHFNGTPLAELLVDRPISSQLISDAYYKLEPVEYYFKRFYDRVRPSYYDPSLTTVISVPDHPAYPSYHATESMFFALILGDIDPDNKEQYVDDALRIADNREIAGVHYKSDSLAGQQLGRDFYEVIQQEVWYTDLVDGARAEW